MRFRSLYERFVVPVPYDKLGNQIILYAASASCLVSCAAWIVVNHFCDFVRMYDNCADWFPSGALNCPRVRCAL